MSTIQIQGLRSLKGEIEVQGSKNAVLPMMAAAILHRGTTVITNVPRIQDVFCMMGILEYMGCKCILDGHDLTIRAETLTSTNIPEHYVKSMRSSIMVLGALLGREKEAVTHYPGGCSIGKRPIDLHLYALRMLGAEIIEMDEAIIARTLQLKGTKLCLDYPSVGATENALLAAVLAEGTTVICGCAMEPEIEELCHFLNAMGAEVKGIGTDRLSICGKSKLHDCVYRVVGDRIVAGTYLSAVSLAGGDVILSGIRPSHMDAVLKTLIGMGAEIGTERDKVRICCRHRPLPACLRTGPYPEFPTDLQSPLLAVLSVSSGIGQIEETVFEGRFETARELQKMGADIIIEESRAFVRGTYPLKGCTVMARDLRGGAALVAAGLAADGITTVKQCQHIMRGYEDICKDLASVGAMTVFLADLPAYI